MAKSIEALANPDLLMWARKSAGFSVEQAARRLKVSTERLTSWELGLQHPTVAMLREIARIYHRPIAVFYLPKPPKGFDVLRDFRQVVVGMEPAEKSPRLVLEIRLAQERREIALDLWSNLESAPPSFDLGASMSDDPIDVAEHIRRSLGISLEEQFSWDSGGTAYSAWRAAIESRGVLVFQTSGVDPSEMRGFSIADRPLPVITVNSKDTPQGRSFTLIHELAHLMIRQGGICDLDEAAPHSDSRAVEVFCNAVAGASLIPRDALLKDTTVLAHGDAVEWSEDELQRLSNRFWTSREVVLRRLLDADRTTPRFYRKMRELYQDQYEGRKSTGGPVYFKRVAYNLGRTYVELVLSNYHERHVSLSDASELLTLRINDISKIERFIFGGIP